MAQSTNSVKHFLPLCVLIGFMFFVQTPAQAQYDPDASRDCNAFYHHQPHDWSIISCERTNNPHYEMEFGTVNACTDQSACCKNCYACCNNSWDEKANCFCEDKPWWVVDQCKNAASTRAPGCRGECLGTFGGGAEINSCSNVANGARNGAEGLRGCDVCDNTVTACLN